MLSDVWSSAGEVITSEKTIGIKAYLISIQLRQLLDDCQFWIENNTFSDEDISIRFKHRLVAIHIFNKFIFTWGQNSLVSKSETRSVYIQALKKADVGEIC